MAPHSTSPESPWETSSYTPSVASIQALKRELRLHHPAAGGARSWISSGPRAVDSHDREVSAGDAALQLSLGEIQEIEDATAYFNGTGLPLNRLQAEHFPLPTLSAKLRRRSLALPNEQPYFLIRGLRPQWFSKRKNVVIFLGIASHVGTKRALAKGDATVLHHVTNIEIPNIDEDKMYRGPANRSMALPFHTDYGEIVSLYTLSLPASGGDFYLADLHDIEAQIRERRPELLETLRADWTMANPGTATGYDERPLLFTLPSNGLAIQASRTRLCDGFRPRPSWLDPLTKQQIRALDSLHAIGQEVAKRFEFRSGDIIFFNNMRMMHARDGFVDGCEDQNTTRRYLLRLILKDERNGEWEVPAELNPTWEELYGHEDEEESISVHESLFSFKAAH